MTIERAKIKMEQKRAEYVAACQALNTAVSAAEKKEQDKVKKAQEKLNAKIEAAEKKVASLKDESVKLATAIAIDEERAALELPRIYTSPDLVKKAS